MTHAMAQPRREIRRDYEATQQMQVAQLQNEYVRNGFTILKGGEELEGIRRRIWAAYDPKTGDTYIFSGTRETSFGTAQSVLDAVGKWVEKENTASETARSMAERPLYQPPREEAVGVEHQDIIPGTPITSHGPIRSQPVQAATETLVRSAARAGESQQPVQPATRAEGPEVRISVADGIMAGYNLRLPFRTQSGTEFLVTIYSDKLTEEERTSYANRAERRMLNTPAGVIELFSLSLRNPEAVKFTYKNGTPINSFDEIRRILS